MNAPLVTDEQRAALLVNGRLAAADEQHDPLPVMRDWYFQAVRRLSECLRLAQENGSIVD